MCLSLLFRNVHFTNKVVSAIDFFCAAFSRSSTVTTLRTTSITLYCLRGSTSIERLLHEEPDYPDLGPMTCKCIQIRKQFLLSFISRLTIAIEILFSECNRLQIKLVCKIIRIIRIQFAYFCFHGKAVSVK